jgi:hypothetical protein
MNPTTEQLAIISAAKTPTNLAISAYAGAGKTSTLVMVAKELTKPSLYIAFNKSIAEEAGTKFPVWVTCKTLHSLAYASIITPNKMFRKVAGYTDTKAVLRLLDSELGYLPDFKALEAVYKVLDLVKEFCQSASFDSSEFIRGYLADSEELADLEPLTKMFNKLWEAMTDPKSTITMTHDVYLKLFQLSKPVLDFEVIYQDEFQDANPVTLDIFYRQKAKLIAVGDAYQCLVEGTLVDDKPIESLQVGDLVSSAVAGTIVSRPITAISKTYKSDKVVKIETSSGRSLTSTCNHTHFARIPKGKHGYMVYLMYREGFGYRIGCTQDFRQRCSAEGASKVWVLGSFGDNQVKARGFEQVTSFTYGVPTLVYQPRSTTNEFPQSYFDEVFAAMSGLGRVTQLFEDFKLSPENPLYIPQAVKKDSITCTITLLGDSRSLTSPYHKYSAILTNEQGSLFNTSFPKYSVRDTGKGNGTCRVEGVSKDLAVCYQLYTDLKEVFPQTSLKELAKVHSGVSFDHVAASCLCPDMEILVEHEGSLVVDTISKVSLEDYKGYVYDLNVQGTHNFIAGGVVTHNCIYAWRGAVDAFKTIPDTWERLKLTESFRFNSEIAGIASKLLYIAGEDSPVVGLGGMKGDGSKAILCRTNLDILTHLLAAKNAKEKVFVMADLADLWSKLYHISALAAGSKPKYPNKQLKMFSNMDELVKESEHNHEFKKLLNFGATLASGQGLHANIVAIKEIVVDKQEDSEYTIATIHKVKGCEYDTVVMDSNCFYPKDDQTEEGLLYSEQTLELMYVAVTRSRGNLSIPPELQEVIANYRDFKRLDITDRA